MKPIKIFHTKVAISKLKYIGNGLLAVIDKENTLRIYNIKEFKLVGGFKVKLPENNPFENSIDISNNGKFIAFGIKGKKKTIVWSIEHKKPLFQLGWHKGDIISVAFDKDSNYLLTGGEDGRSYIWSMKNGKMIYSLYRHADYVLSVDFALNSMWVATSSYDKSIIFSNIVGMDLVLKRRSHSSAVTKIKFISNHRLVSGDKNGELLVWNYTNGEVIKRLEKMSSTIVDFAFANNYKYMFVIAKDYLNVACYNLENYKLLVPNILKLLSSPTSIEIIPELNYLVIGNLDGDIEIYNFLDDEQLLKEYFTANKIKEIYELVSKNPLLEDTETFKHIEKHWERVLKKAQILLENGEVKKARLILEPYLQVPSKRGFIQNLLKDFNEFEKFKLAVIKKNYPVAYSLVAKYPFLKETNYYKLIEKEWENAFNKAKRLILSKDSEDLVKELLKPFRGVPQKTPLIQALFNDRKLYDLLNQKFRKRDFKEFFKLIHKYPFLTETKEYKDSIKFAEALIKKATLALKEGNYKLVLNISEILEDFPMFQKEAEEFKKEASILLAFQRAVATKDYKLIDKYVQEYPFLEDTIDYKNLEKEFKNKLETAEYLIHRKEVKKALALLDEYMHFEQKRGIIGNLIKSGYLEQILDLIKMFYKKEIQDPSKIENAVRNYIVIFGKDSEISDLIEKINKLNIKLNLEDLVEGKPNEWYLKTLPNDISEKIY